MPDTADPAPAAEPVKTTTRTYLFGQALSLATPPDPFTVADSEWRGKAIYEPFLTARPLPKTGIAVDIGAAYGGFAIPFALAYPGWTIWCFEPDSAAFEALRANIETHRAGNAIAVNTAVGGAGMVPELANLLARGWDGADPGRIRTACPERPFQRHREKPGFVKCDPVPGDAADFDEMLFPALPPEALAGLGPDLVKLTAPGADGAVLEALRDTAAAFILGEIWHALPSGAAIRRDGRHREVHLPLAGTPLALRQTRDSAPQRPELDVVVALYNAKDYIRDCIDSIIGNDCAAVRALVVDDGSTDGSGDLVAKIYAGNPRVRLLRKPNGGCASARNFGRLHSETAHIAFVDADDMADPQMFPKLLDLARYCGAEIVQAGFAFLHADEDAEGGLRLEPSYEADALAGLERRFLGDMPYFVAPGTSLMIGQPTIWRRIYRRDFLDNKKIWFPEHIRAFDDQIFQMLSLFYAGDIFCTDQVRYHYRQHPDQDIRQGDERFFYSLEMFRMMLKRGLAEGWNDFRPLLQSYVNTVNWIHGGLRPDLQPAFLDAAAELWVYMGKSLGAGIGAPLGPERFEAPDFGYHMQRHADRLDSLEDGFMWGYLDGIGMHVDAIRAGRAR